MHQNGSVQLVRDEDIARKVDLWLTFDSSKGYLKVKDVLDALDWDDVFYVDEKGFEIQISAHECGELQGFSTDRFYADQVISVFGRKFLVNDNPGGALYDAQNKIVAIQEIGVEPSLLQENDTFCLLLTSLDKVTTTIAGIRELIKSYSKLNTA
ncbi:hypothetical protein L7F22_002400 [Adiantum nelumboides]|nr:hypothetical protein [Adiantum nelumboides]